MFKTNQWHSSASLDVNTIAGKLLILPIQMYMVIATIINFEAMKTHTVQQNRLIVSFQL